MIFDDTQTRIMDATMSLITEKGYSGATTKNIAKLAGVNECTIFRRFENKQAIVISALELPKWNPGLREEDFVYVGDLKADLAAFSKKYMEKVTPDMVRISIGLRSAELEGAALPGIMKIPLLLKSIFMKYFEEMIGQGKMRACDTESLALQFITMNFGFVFFNASFGEKLIGITIDEYIENSVDCLILGIGQQKMTKGQRGVTI